MSSNSFGKILTVTTFGESHGPAIGCVVDGCPPGLALVAEDFHHDLARRATGKSRYTSQRHEADEVEILSGVYEGKTTGTPIALLIRNTDARSKDYTEIAQTFRPGHADYTYWQKYGIRDPRGGGRASARETTMRVAAGVIAKKWLSEKFHIVVRGYLAQIGDLTPHLPADGAIDWDAVEANPFFWPDASMVPELEKYIDALRKSGDSVGARVTVVADNVPPGWGEPIYGKLDGELASALDVDQRSQGRRNRRGVRRGGATWQRASRRNQRTGIPVEPLRWNSRRHFLGPAAGRFDGVETDIEHPDPWAQRESRRCAGRSRDQGTPRSLRRHSRHADRRSDGGPGADGSGVAPSCPVRRCRRRRTAHSR